MNRFRIALPLQVVLPDEWAVGTSARLYANDLREVGRVEHLRTTTRRVWGLIASVLDTASLFIGNADTALCSIKLPGGADYELFDDAGTLGRIAPRTFSIWPELECTDEQGVLVGRIKPGITKVRLIEGERMILGQRTGKTSADPFAGHAGWNITSRDATDVDARLLLCAIALDLVPSSAGS